MADPDNKRGRSKFFLGAIVGIGALVIILIANFIGQRDDKPSTKSTAAADSISSAYAEVETIPGIAAVDLHGNLTDRGFSLDKNLSSAIKSWTCTQKNESNMYEAIVYGRGATEITKIQATAQNYSTGNTGKMAAEFLGFVATLPYDGATPAQSRTWVENNINSNTSTVIGGVTFEIFGSGSQTRILEMTAN
jgi:hypothetical protein